MERDSRIGVKLIQTGCRTEAGRHVKSAVGRSSRSGPGGSRDRRDTLRGCGSVRRQRVERQSLAQAVADLFFLPVGREPLDRPKRRGARPRPLVANIAPDLALLHALTEAPAAQGAVQTPIGVTSACSRPLTMTSASIR